jgi:hypothetical protein
LKQANATISTYLIPLLVAAMWAGLLWSRALLSMSMIGFLLAGTIGYPFRQHLHYVRQSPFLWIMPLFVLPPLVSGAWSEDSANWLRIVQLKIPLLLLPLFSLPLRNISPASRRWLAVFVGGTLALAMLVSTWHYLQAPQDTAEAYLRAKVLPVAMGNDHVRFGWLLCIIFAWGLHLYPTVSANRRWLLAFLVFVFIFQHLLASKTGLLGTYLVLVVWAVRYRQQAWVRWASILAATAPLLAWWLLPTFRNRMRFVWWDFQHYSRGAVTEGLSDTPRILSLRAGEAIWREHPWLGTGFGDLRAVLTDWYTRNVPSLQPYEQLLPSNQFLLYASAAGWISGLLALAAAILPLGIRMLRRQPLWIAFHLLSIAGFLYEIALETQYGVFIYAFLGCWIHAILKEEQDLQH